MYVNRTCSNLLYLCYVIFLFSLISLIGAHFITLSPIPFLLSKVYNIFMCYLISWLHLPYFIQQHRLLWSQLTFYASERSVGKKNLYKTTLDWLSEYNTKTPTDLLMFVARNHWLVIGQISVSLLYVWAAYYITATLLKPGLLLCLVTSKKMQICPLRCANTCNENERALGV